MSEASETTTKPRRSGPMGPSAAAWNVRRYKWTFVGWIVAGTAISAAVFETVRSFVGVWMAAMVMAVVGILLAISLQMMVRADPPTTGTWEGSAIRPDAPLARYCAHCAAPNAIGSSYCSNCGDRL